MFFFKKLIITLANILGIIFPGLFLQKKFLRKSSLTIYSLHSTSRIYFNEYLTLLKKIDKFQNFISPDKLDNFFRGEYGDKSYSLLTLDDGFDDNYLFAKEVLNKLNIKAIFFVIPKFINKNYSSINDDFFKVLYPNYNLKLLNNLKETFVPINLNKIIKIKNLGHTIGMHGYNHENFGELNENEVSIIIQEGIKIFKEYNLDIKHFAYPFGNTTSFNDKSNQIISRYFDYIYLGTRGFNFITKNTNKKNTKFLNRHPLSTHNNNLFYYPIKYSEVYFFTHNRINFFINMFYKINIYNVIKNFLN